MVQLKKIKIKKYTQSFKTANSDYTQKELNKKSLVACDDPIYLADSIIELAKKHSEEKIRRADDPAV